MKINATIWGENIHDKKNKDVKKIYPDGMHSCIEAALKNEPNINTKTATLDQDNHGLSDDILRNTDVLLWWGHAAHDQVEDHIVDKVHARVLEGMGLIALHSSHYSKIFRKLMGTTCSLVWREAGELERVWVCNPGHPITNGLGRYFEIPQSEMYGEPFQVPPAEETIFSSWYQGGETFRSGLIYKRGNGKIFYFSPGHETYPIYHQKEVKLVLCNAVKWACSEKGTWKDDYTRHPSDPIEKIETQGPQLHKPGEEGFR